MDSSGTVVSQSASRGGPAAGLIRWYHDLVQDLRFAVRGLGRHPGFAFIAALTMAIGIGATTAVLAIADGVLFGLPPVPEADRLVSIWELRQGLAFESLEGRPLPYERYEAYEEATRDVFDGLAAHAYADFSLRSGAGAIALDGFLTSPNYFDVLHLSSAVGSLYDRDEPVVVLSSRLWRSRFGADPELVGSTVWIDSRPFTVIGIAPDGFTGTLFGFGGDAWIPALAYRAQTGTSGAVFGGATTLAVPIGRLAEGVDRDAAAARVDQVARTIPPEDPQVTVQGARLDGIAWRGDLLDGARIFIAMLVCAAGLLLLIACANIAAMLFARAIGRQREVAVRLAIGAGRGRLVRQLLTESLLLFVIGGAGGLLIAEWVTRLASKIQLPFSATIAVNVAPDPLLVASGLLLAALTGAVFTLGPALRTSRVDLTTSLKEGGLGPRGSDRSRTLFVTAQFALSVMLLVTAGLFLRSLRAGLDVDLAFDPGDVTVATIGLAAHGYDEVRGRAFQRELIERVRAVPEVESAALARLVLLGGMAEGSSVRAAEWDPAERSGLSSRSDVVDASFFETMRVPVVAGRGFTTADVAGGTPVAVINQRMAEELWPGENAVGRHLRTGGREYEVVGVTRDGRYTFVTEQHAFVFTSLEQNYSPLASLHVRTRGPAPDLRGRLEEIVRDLDPNVAVEDVRRMRDVVAMSLFPQRFASAMMGVFALIGLILATTGIYGVLALFVAQRSREFGIRMALGAGTSDVLVLVLRRGLAVAAAGCVLGLLMAAGVTRFIRSFLFGVGPLDVVTFSIAPGIIMLTALIACAAPARRAIRSDPLDTLRQE